MSQINSPPTDGQEGGAADAPRHGLDLVDVLFPTDLSPESKAAFPCAVAAARKGEGRVTVLYMVDTENPLPGRPFPVTSDGELHRLLRERAEARLALDVEVFQAEGVTVTTKVVVTASVAESIRKATAGGNHGLVVMATHGRRGLARLLQGSYAEDTLRRATCPVLLVRTDQNDVPITGPGPDLQGRKVLFPTDLSPESLAAYPMAADWARRAGGEVTVLFLEDLGNACLDQGLPLRSEDEVRPFLERRAKDRLEGVTDPFQAEGVPYKLEGRAARLPAEAICAAAGEGEYDVIVMATHGRQGFARLVSGSVTEETARLSPCPVLAVRVV